MKNKEMVKKFVIVYRPYWSRFNLDCPREWRPNWEASWREGKVKYYIAGRTAKKALEAAINNSKRGGV